MARPMNETAEDLAREAEVARVVEGRWRCKAEKLSISYHVDFALYRDGWLIALGEVKCRNVSSDRYETLMLSVLKAERGASLALSCGVPFIVFAAFTDKTLWTEVTILFKERDWKIAHSGRTDRGQDGDLEPCVHIPMSEFKPLNTQE